MTTHPLNQAGIAETFRTTEWQRRAKAFDEHAVLVEGQLVSAHAPKDLLGLLPMPHTALPTSSAWSTRPPSTASRYTASSVRLDQIPTADPEEVPVRCGDAFARDRSRSRCGDPEPLRSWICPLGSPAAAGS